MIIIQIINKTLHIGSKKLLESHRKFTKNLVKTDTVNSYVILSPELKLGMRWTNKLQHCIGKQRKLNCLKRTVMST